MCTRTPTQEQKQFLDLTKTKTKNIYTCIYIADSLKSQQRSLRWINPFSTDKGQFNLVWPWATIALITVICLTCVCLYPNKWNQHEMIILVYFVVMLQHNVSCYGHGKWPPNIYHSGNSSLLLAIVRIDRRFLTAIAVRNLVRFWDLDAGSENGDNTEGNGTVTDGSAILVPHKHLSLEGMELLLHTINVLLHLQRKIFFRTRLLWSEYAEVKTNV